MFVLHAKDVFRVLCVTTSIRSKNKNSLTLKICDFYIIMASTKVKAFLVWRRLYSMQHFPFC